MRGLLLATCSVLPLVVIAWWREWRVRRRWRRTWARWERHWWHDDA